MTSSGSRSLHARFSAWRPKGRITCTVGGWARQFVDAVQARGGALARGDLEHYRALWDEPLLAPYGGCDIAVPALPALGGAHLVQALHLLACAKFPRDTHYSQSAELLYWLIQIARAARLGPSLPIQRRSA